MLNDGVASGSFLKEVAFAFPKGIIRFQRIFQKHDLVFTSETRVTKKKGYVIS
jgi:hypothetical protein